MNNKTLNDFVEGTWDKSIVPTLKKYLAVPNQSPAFDAEWRTNGYTDQAVDIMVEWIRTQNVPGLTLEVIRLGERTPLLFVEIAGEVDDTVLLYGHLDKQPPMDGWATGLGPWKPVLRGSKLYGRGGADDGYAVFACVTAINALKLQGIPTARHVVLIEACEESGSGDLPHYITTLENRIGEPSLVICLDSGCGNYTQLWLTASLRGLVSGNLSVSTLTEGVHSGAASGIVPSSFRVLRQLLTRLEDENTGEIVPSAFKVDIPEERLGQARTMATELGSGVSSEFPFRKGGRPVTGDITEQLLNRTWRSQLEITGAAGLPSPEQAGNVLRPVTTVKVSLRIPPTLEAAPALATLKRLFEEDPPHGAHVRFEPEWSASGWNSPVLAPWLETALDNASTHFFGKNFRTMGEGGTIPFMAMLGERFPSAQFVITGVLGPQSNAHGPNEFLEIPTAKKLTCCIASVLKEHGNDSGG